MAIRNTNMVPCQLENLIVHMLTISLNVLQLRLRKSLLSMVELYLDKLLVNDRQKSKQNHKATKKNEEGMTDTSVERFTSSNVCS